MRRSDRLAPKGAQALPRRPRRRGKPFNRPADRDERPKGKPGWDGKPREKKFFRKDS